MGSIPPGPMRGALGVLAALSVGVLSAAVVSDSPHAAGQSVSGPETYQNPVHRDDLPDPFVLRAASGYYAYGTNRGLANIQILRSDDLVTWTDLGTALPFLPEWASGPFVWAPSVLARGDRHILYYSVRERATGLFCVSRAVSGHGPQGPFVDRSVGPLVCQRNRRGTIDPSPFVDGDDTAWLLHKSEGIEGAEPTRIWIQRLTPDGQHVAGPPHQLAVTDQPWEEPIIENPAMVGADGLYFLFYSANRWQSADYAVGWAVCDSPVGPCRKPMSGPLFASSNGAAGPGGVEFFTGADGGTWMAYHAWEANVVGYPKGARSLRIDRVTFSQGRPWVHAPTTATMRFDDVPGPPPAPPAPPPPATAQPATAQPATAQPGSAPPAPALPTPPAEDRATLPAGTSGTRHPVILPEPTPVASPVAAPVARPAGFAPGEPAPAPRRVEGGAGLPVAGMVALLMLVALLFGGYRERWGLPAAVRQRAARARSRAPRG